ncbi:MAG TPA: MEDS domain-containing protein [Mycobacteriales bacterium]|nr:MEDS domain-containing protein [Mycobacteriales bacterium]
MPTELESRPADVSTLARGDHACWSYSSDEEHAEVLRAFLVAGLREDERVLYVGDESEVRAMLSDLAAVADTGTLLRDGKLVVGDVDDAYLPDGVFDPAACVEGFRDVALQAVDDGYAGVRVAGENTSILNRPGMLQLWYDYEIRVELLTASMPILGLCCFDRRHSDDPVLAILDSVHRVAIGTASVLGFTVHGRADGRLSLAGEVDAFTVPQLKQVLSGAARDVDDLVIDVAGLEFIDSSGLRLLDRLAHGRIPRQGPITVVGATSHLRGIWQLLRPDHASAVVLQA